MSRREKWHLKTVPYAKRSRSFESFLMPKIVPKLRQATVEDAQSIRALTREAYAKWVAIIGREPVPMAIDYIEALKKHRFDLLFLDQKLAALIETTSDANHLLIINVAVSPQYQGRGLGRRLMDHAESLAATSGYSQIKLYTNKLFAENLAFYDALGYEVEREENFKGGITVYLRKTI